MFIVRYTALDSNRQWEVLSLFMDTTVICYIHLRCSGGMTCPVTGSATPSPEPTSLLHIPSAQVPPLAYSYISNKHFFCQHTQSWMPNTLNLPSPRTYFQTIAARQLPSFWLSLNLSTEPVIKRIISLFPIRQVTRSHLQPPRIVPHLEAFDWTLDTWDDFLSWEEVRFPKGSWP